MDDQGFVEIETPMLMPSTPEGAREFLVPSRQRPGAAYALPQSPQLFKQLLMVAGLERYYQIARCYRDEDFRADRQPEFTQLDVEMSFVDADDVIAVSEQVLKALWALIGYDLPLPLPRISYADAMRRFGTDKPDLRFGLELVECTDYFKGTPFRVFQAPYVGAVVMPSGAAQPRRTLDGWQEFAKQRGHKGLAYVLVAEDGTLGGPVAKNLSDAERDGLAAHVGAGPGDCVFFAAGPAKTARALLGATRIEIAKRLGMIDPAAWAFTWVVDFPLFEAADEATAAGEVTVGAGAWTAVHHAFTGPKPESESTFDTDPGSALADAYDIVCNGNEIGGGSIRIHRRDIQERVFAMMGIDHDEAQDKFGFLLDAFTFGAPPHGGIAFGWDRITALLAGEDTIREVIAFPKTGGGVDPLTDAPAPITAQQRKESGIDAKPQS
jgi:aspartyl-tRNA synthetase